MYNSSVVLEILVTLNANEQFQLRLFHLIYAFVLIEHRFWVCISIYFT